VPRANNHLEGWDNLVKDECKPRILKIANEQLSELVGQPATAQTYARIKYIQSNAWNSWATASSATTTGSGWPTGWLDTSVTTGGCQYTVTYTSNNTQASDDIWATPEWLHTEHTNRYFRAASEGIRRASAKSPEQLAQEAAEHERRRQARLREDSRKRMFKEAANERARRILMSMLNDEQRRDLAANNNFQLTVHSRDGSIKVYRIDYGYQGNVKLLGPDGDVDRSYCIHADRRLPYEDQMLAQKLLLENNEEEFLRIANETIRRRRAA